MFAWHEECLIHIQGLKGLKKRMPWTWNKLQWISWQLTSVYNWLQLWMVTCDDEWWWTGSISLVRSVNLLNDSPPLSTPRPHTGNAGPLPLVSTALPHSILQIRRHKQHLQVHPCGRCARQASTPSSSFYPRFAAKNLLARPAVLALYGFPLGIV